jgi:hypothetical protein
MKEKFRLTLDFDLQSSEELRGEGSREQVTDSLQVSRILSNPDLLKTDYKGFISLLLTSDVFSDDISIMPDTADEEEFLVNILKNLSSYKAAFLLKIIYGKLKPGEDNLKRKRFVEDIYQQLKPLEKIVNVSHVDLKKLGSGKNREIVRE